MCQGKEIKQIVAGSYARPTQLIDVAHPEALFPGAVQEHQTSTEYLLNRSRPHLKPLSTLNLQRRAYQRPFRSFLLWGGFVSTSPVGLVAAVGATGLLAGPQAALASLLSPGKRSSRRQRSFSRGPRSLGTGRGQLRTWQVPAWQERSRGQRAEPATKGGRFAQNLRGRLWRRREKKEIKIIIIKKKKSRSAATSPWQRSPERRVAAGGSGELRNRSSGGARPRATPAPRSPPVPSSSPLPVTPPDPALRSAFPRRRGRREERGEEVCQSFRYFFFPFFFFSLFFFFFSPPRSLRLAAGAAGRGAGRAAGSSPAAGVCEGSRREAPQAAAPHGAPSGPHPRTPPRPVPPPSLPGGLRRAPRRCPRRGPVRPPPRARGAPPKERERLTHGSAAGEAGDTSGFRGAGEVNCTEVQVVFSPIRSGRLKEGERGGGGGGGRGESRSRSRSLSHTHTHTPAHTHTHTEAQPASHTHRHTDTRTQPHARTRPLGSAPELPQQGGARTETTRAARVLISGK
nr:translation initiation factor IF-2 [Anas platyrhynchos]